MCKSPIRIKNRAKYINFQHGHPIYLWVNCGNCSECRQQKQLEWNLRTYYKCLDVLQKGGYIYFDTLTYNNENMPRLSQYLDTTRNYPCFNPKHIREFYESLRQRIGNKTFDYFIVSEYGDIRKRPHYHIMLYVYGNINPIELSEQVHNSWKYGRTDGIPYKSQKYVLEHNTINNMNLDAIRYISKYVSKQMTFIDIINKRWRQLENYYKHTKFDTIQIKKIRQQYYRHTTPFHRQSQHHGENALLYLDLKDLVENNRMYYKDDSLKINQYCSLPMYYKRKLTQTQIKYNGKRMWINTEDGAEWRKEQEKTTILKLTDRLKDQARTLGKRYTEIELQELAYYIIKERGRLKGENDYLSHHKEAEAYNYNTDKDLINLGKKVISKNFAGNDKVGYLTTEIEPIEIENLICIKPQLEAIIDDLKVDEDNKSLVLLKEHINEIRKIFFQNT